MADKVQFREDPEVIAFVEAQGVNPHELARRLFEAEVRRMRAKDRRARLNALAFRGLAGADAVRIIREERDR